MKIGIIILCRYDSTRLPGKILRQIQGKAILQYIYERLLSTCSADSLVVATSVESTDDIIVKYCQEHGIQYFRGSKDNVAQRFLDCANAYGFDYAVRINGDNLFTDASLLKSMVSLTESDQYDFVSNVKGRTFPRGMSIEIVRRDFYQKAIQAFDRAEYFEHVTLFFYQHEEYGRQFHMTNQVFPAAAGINLALDTQEDLALAESMISRMTADHTTYHLQDIYHLWNHNHKDTENR